MFFEGESRLAFNSDGSPYGSTGFQPVSYGMTPQGNCWCTSWDTSADDCAALAYSAGYVYADADGLGAPVAIEGSSGNYQYVATDPQGNVIYQTSSSSRIVLIKYDAYGNVYNTSAGDLNLPFRFAGMRYEKDADIYLTPNRAYSPALGRWLTPDPLGTLPNAKQGNRFAPLSQYTDGRNLYEYCAGDPVNERDIWGLTPWSPYPGTGYYIDSQSYQQSRCGKCGPDITFQFIAAMRGTEKDLLNSFEKDKILKKKVCGFSGIYSPAGWDIFLSDEYGGKISQSGYPSGVHCENTVTFNGRCVNKWELNYYLWGMVNKACDNSWHKTSFYANWAYLRPGDPTCKKSYTKAGYQGQFYYTNSKCDQKGCSTKGAPTYKTMLTPTIRGFTVQASSK